jgi:hypothetical protein
MALKQVSFSRSPKIKIHKYVVVVGRPVKKVWHEKYHYCVSLKEVKAVGSKAPTGAIVEVYKAGHQFLKAFEVK